MEFNATPMNVGVWDENGLEYGQTQLNTQSDNVSAGAFFDFENDVVMVRVGLSNVDILGAWSNLETEQSSFDIDTTANQAKAAWENALSVIDIWGGTQRDQTIFATGLYHALQMPTLFSDVDGRGLMAKSTSDRSFYTDFSLWDTYRTAHPLYTVLWPDLHEDLLRH